ncbi:MAG: TRAP transporter substrate-binding protein DctP [Parvibaculum sp.]
MGHLAKSMAAALAAALVSAGAVLVGTASLAKAAEIEWSLQTVAGAGTTEYKQLVERFADYVDQLTGGRVAIKTFPAGMLMKSSEVAGAVSKGTLEMGHTFLVYYSGKEPALKAVNEWPAMVQPLQGVMWFYEGGGAEIMREITAKHDMHFLGVSPLLGEHIWAKKPLNGVEDLKGIKIRASALAADSFARLGASVVSLSGEEVYQALQRGVVDATEFTTMPVNYGFGFHEIAKYVMLPSYSGGGTSDWIVNMKAWNELPDVLKPKMEQALRLVSYDYYRQSRLEEEDVKDKLHSAGVKMITWSETDMRKLERARIDVMREKYAAESPLFAKKLDSQLKFLERLGYENATR